MTYVLPSAAELTDAIENDDNMGFCIKCGEPADGVEPDAERYTCECCEKAAVYGAEQLLLLGLYR